MDTIKILLADDHREVCDSLEDNIMIELEKFGLTYDDVEIKKLYTEHAYEHGCICVQEGFRPDICIFDLVFNGYSGIDLYKFITNVLSGKKINLCIYAGIEKKIDKSKEVEVMSSAAQGLIVMVEKPNISEILLWIQDILETTYKIKKTVQEPDLFDLL